MFFECVRHKILNYDPHAFSNIFVLEYFHLFIIKLKDDNISYVFFVF